MSAAVDPPEAELVTPQPPPGGSGVTSSPTVALVCPACGEAFAAGDVFCEACGADLPPTVGPAPTPDPEEPDSLDEGLSLPTDRGITADPCPACGAAAIAVVEGYCGVCGMKQPAARDHTEATADGVAAVTDRGQRHHRNEDAFAMAVTDDGQVVAVVCDGVSTTVDPDIASQAASDAALAVLVAGGDLPAAYGAARDAVLALSWVPDPRLGAPSCTFLAAVVDGSQVELATLGDCRSMWLPADGTAGEPDTLTEDDSWAAEVIAAGTKTAEEAYADRRAHVITRWLGADADPSWEARLSSFTAPGPGRLLLCSDGLWNYAETAAEVAAAAVGEPDDLLSTARRLTDFANAAGGSDNITVLLVDLPRSSGHRSKGPAA
ncbi:MAG: hypothetical protein QOG82_1999 [Actinomycetota bacterium]|nr:hypothetical protein [Actinomycetota bacterium]